MSSTDAVLAPPSDLDPLPPALSSMWRLCKLGYRHEPRLMLVAFVLSQTAGRPSGAHTQMAFAVDDIVSAVRDLKARGVVFEEFDLPGLTTVDGIAEVGGNYPSKGGIGELGAWFRDSEGNLLGIAEPIRSEL